MIAFAVLEIDHQTFVYTVHRYGCYQAEECKRPSKATYSVVGWEGHHVYRIAVTNSNWDAEGDERKSELVLAWPLDNMPEVKAVNSLQGCKLVGFNAHTISVTGSGSDTDCTMQVQAGKVRGANHSARHDPLSRWHCQRARRRN